MLAVTIGSMHGDGERPHLWLVRHGETEWARLGRHTGRTDIPLTELGREQATRAWPDGSPVTTSRSSSPAPCRGRSTRRGSPASAIASRPTDDLLEWDYGADEGRTTPRSATNVRAGRSGARGRATARRPTRSRARVDRVIARVRAVDGDALVFAHGHVLRVLAARWLGQPPTEGRLYALATATVSELGWERETPVIERWNDARPD